jgi:cytochrome c-type biogenesis protein
VIGATITASPLGVLIAFGAGIISFLSPCVLPLVPGYVSLVSGLSAAELHDAEARRRHLRHLLLGIGLFVAGFTLVFVATGAVASGLGQLLGHHKADLTTASGVVVIVLGTILLLSALPAPVWARLGATVSGRIGSVAGAERRFQVRADRLGMWAAPVAGMAFAFAWTPCLGPVLAAVLGLAATRSTLGGAILLLFVYSLGLGVPFLVMGVAFDRLTGLFARARRVMGVIQLVGGIVLVAFGAILVAGDIGWLSAQFSTLLDHLGLHRLTVS